MKTGIDKLTPRDFLTIDLFHPDDDKIKKAQTKLVAEFAGLLDITPDRARGIFELVDWDWTKAVSEAMLTRSQGRKQS